VNNSNVLNKFKFYHFVTFAATTRFCLKLCTSAHLIPNRQTYWYGISMINQNLHSNRWADSTQNASDSTSNVNNVHFIIIIIITV